MKESVETAICHPALRSPRSATLHDAKFHQYRKLSGLLGDTRENVRVGCHLVNPGAASCHVAYAAIGKLVSAADGGSVVTLLKLSIARLNIFRASPALRIAILSLP